MRAVNLVPAESRRGRGFAGTGAIGPAHVLVALLGIAVLFVTIYVLSSNTINERKAKIASLQAQANQEQAAASNLNKYVEFEKLAQTRVETVRQIASSRFDWHSALSDLSKVVPASTSLQSLLGTVAPGATVNGAGGTAGGASGSPSGVGTGTLRGLEPGPAFELKGCTASHDDVARLMSRLRVINGVTRVTLADSQKPDAAGVGSAVSGASSSSGGSATGCGKDKPFFDAVVFFRQIPNAGPAGVASGGASGAAGASGASGAAGAAGATTAAAPSSSSSSTTAAASTSTSSGSSSSQPVSNSTSGSGK